MPDRRKRLHWYAGEAWKGDAPCGVQLNRALWTQLESVWAAQPQHQCPRCRAWKDAAATESP